ncbi:MAG: S-methyl-5'-thioadenosine phosphorylase, partial [Actinomycetota bacterium]|nr:S-methyl-5'-thioadenosine phosphorylase [Actinomycetota bacterium]
VIEAGQAQGVTIHPTGTIVVVQGPRFSTRAESTFYGAQGWDVINMTQYPEAALARELEICCVNISVVTDYDSALPEEQAVTVEAVVARFGEMIEQLRRLIFDVIPRIPESRSCPCGEALKDARLG